ncbi:hypothetical protein HDV02_005762 [Globomyces sp. JEL0801]|nr:hypothetical protein HDV02_005762 [Globomyces sp. JEL0801]
MPETKDSTIADCQYFFGSVYPLLVGAGRPRYTQRDCCRIDSRTSQCRSGCRLPSLVCVDGRLTMIEASEDYESESDSELKLTKGDIIQVYEHQYNGWCLGQNKTTDKVGLIPVQCIVPQSPKLYIVDCEQTQFSLPKVLEYVITVFPENIKLVRLDMTQVQGSLKDLFALEKFNPDMVGLFAGSVEFEERMERELHLFWISVEAGKV